MFFEERLHTLIGMQLKWCLMTGYWTSRVTDIERSGR